MSFTTGRFAIRLTTLILLALLVGGCGEDSAQAKGSGPVTRGPRSIPTSTLLGGGCFAFS